MYQPRSITKQRPAPAPPQVEMTEPTSAIMINLESITSANEVQAQKEAAWSEVARRLAHEIKNPLTPIKLSAERMTMKYGNLLLYPDKKNFSKLTKTIIQQVDIIKDMVDELLSC